LIGATGQIGRQMMQRFGSRALPTTRERMPAAGWLSLDLAEIATFEQADLALKGVELDAIYCLAGMTNVEACEGQASMAYRVNTEAPTALAEVAYRRKLPFVYYSTEYVFDGLDGPYGEGDPTNPKNVYGLSKVRGELAIRQAHPEALILRTTVVYGPDSAEKNYLYSLMRNLKMGKSMKVPEDQVSTPTYNLDLAVVTETLVKRGVSGLFHACGSERMGRFAFARQIAEELGLDPSLLQGVPTSELNQIAPRPLSAGLSIDKLTREHPDLSMRTLHEGIKNCRSLLERYLLSA